MLAKFGSASGVLLVGNGGLLGNTVVASGIHDFDPYDLDEVKRFTEQHLVQEKVEQRDQPDKFKFVEEIDGVQKLSETQREALADGLRPVTVSSVIPESPALTLEVPTARYRS